MSEVQYRLKLLSVGSRFLNAFTCYVIFILFLLNVTQILSIFYKHPIITKALKKHIKSIPKEFQKHTKSISKARQKHAKNI